MKRTALFGALGCVWAALAVSLTFIGSLTDFVSIYDQAYHIGDYRIIHAAWFLFEALGLDSVVGLSCLLTLLAWLLGLRGFGFIGRKRMRPRRRFPVWLRDMGGVPGVLLRTLSVAAAGYGLRNLAWAMSGSLSFELLPFYSLGFVKGLFVWTLLEAGPPVFLFFSMTSFVHAEFANDRFADIARSFAVPAAGLAGFFAVSGAAYIAAGGMDVYGTLADTPGITAARTPDTLYVLAEEPVEHTAHVGFPDFNMTSPRFGDETPFSMTFCEENEGAVCGYLREGGLPSVRAIPAYDYLFSYRIRRLDMPGLMEMLAEAWERTGEPVYWNLCLTWITRGARSDGRRELLTRLADESKYSIPGRSAIKVSAAYAKYGEMDRARYWYLKGISSGRNFSTKDMAVYEPGDEPPFSGGVIRGRVDTPGGITVSGVGILPPAVINAYGYAASDIERTRLLTMSIADGTAPGSDGSFGFEGLPAGEYLLMLSIPGEGGYKISSLPGVITVSEGDPVHDVGVIELSGGAR